MMTLCATMTVREPIAAHARQATLAAAQSATILTPVNHPRALLGWNALILIRHQKTTCVAIVLLVLRALVRSAKILMTALQLRVEMVGPARMKLDDLCARV